MILKEKEDCAPKRPTENLVFDYTTLVHLPQLQSIYVDGEKLDNFEIKK